MFYLKKKYVTYYSLLFQSTNFYFWISLVLLAWYLYYFPPTTKLLHQYKLVLYKVNFFSQSYGQFQSYSEIKVCTNIFYLTDSNHKWTFGLPRFKKWIQWQKLRATYWSRVSTSHTRSNSTIPKNIFQRRAVNQPIARFTSKIWTQCCKYIFKIHKYVYNFTYVYPGLDLVNIVAIPLLFTKLSLFIKSNLDKE